MLHFKLKLKLNKLSCTQIPIIAMTYHGGYGRKKYVLKKR